MSDYKTLSLDTTDIDFQDIRTNLKEYLKGQDEFKDYDFDGSAMSAIIDMLAYVTHYNAINANIGINETFLQSSKFRGSVVGHARMLGYIPKSATSSIAFVDVLVNNPNTPYLFLSKYTVFNSSANGTSFDFLVAKDYETENGFFEDVKLIEGKVQTTTYVYDQAGYETYSILEKNVDISTLKVEIIESKFAPTAKTLYHPAKKLADIKSDSLIYFIHETHDGTYEISFGDGVFGKKLEQGNVIKLTYVVTRKGDANGAGVFQNLESIAGNENITVTTKQRASGGSEKEQISDIKFRAPITFAAQNRAVTYRDYEGLLYDSFGNIDLVKCWGGEDLDRPIYGKVYLSIKPKDSEFLTVFEKEYILNEVLKPKMMVTVTPEIVDPDYLYVIHNTSFTYDPEITTESKVQLKEDVKGSISDYANTVLNKFQSRFSHSNFLSVIDKTDQAILYSSAEIFIQKRFIPTLNVHKYYELKFTVPFSTNKLIPNIIVATTKFSIGELHTNCRFKDRLLSDGTRTLDIVKGSESVEEFVAKNIGYLTADSIVLQQFAPSLINGPSLAITVLPDTKDITVKENNILILDETNSTITPKTVGN